MKNLVKQLGNALLGKIFPPQFVLIISKYMFMVIADCSLRAVFLIESDAPCRVVSRIRGLPGKGIIPQLLWGTGE
jgi:hypothetical protein